MMQVHISSTGILCTILPDPVQVYRIQDDLVTASCNSLSIPRAGCVPAGPRPSLRMPLRPYVLGFNPLGPKNKTSNLSESELDPLLDVVGRTKGIVHFLLAQARHLLVEDSEGPRSHPLTSPYVHVSHLDSRRFHQFRRIS